jgi:hypothetical protein
MKCECGKELTREEMELNDKIAKNVKRLDYCEDCWDNYCHHAITGE